MVDAVDVLPEPSVAVTVKVNVPGVEVSIATPLGVGPTQLATLTMSAQLNEGVTNSPTLYTTPDRGLAIVTDGRRVSRTVTVNVFVDLLPDASVAVMTTVVVPTGK